MGPPLIITGIDWQRFHQKKHKETLRNPLPPIKQIYNSSPTATPLPVKVTNLVKMTVSEPAKLGSFPVPNPLQTAAKSAAPLGSWLGIGFLDKASIGKIVASVVISKVEDLSRNLLFTGAQKFINGCSKTSETDLNAAVDKSMELQIKYNEVIEGLAPLVNYLHEDLKQQTHLLYETEKSLSEKLEEGLKLQRVLDTLTPEKLNSAIEKIAKEVSEITSKHQGNLPELAQAINDLEEAEKNLANAQSNLSKAEQEFSNLVEELSTLELLISQEGIEQEKEIQMLLQKTESLL